MADKDKESPSPKTIEANWGRIEEHSHMVPIQHVIDTPGADVEVAPSDPAAEQGEMPSSPSSGDKQGERP